MKVNYRASRISVVALAAALGSFLSTYGYAQTATGGQVAATPAPNVSATATDDDKSTKDIIVTGTLIRGAAPVGSTIIAIDRHDIEKTGLATTTDILKSVPQITNIGPSANAGAVVTQNSNLNNTRADAINIRGIGPQATLPLLDGRRVPPGGSGAQLYDASSIPSIALARIDVVADGASATYGSDAVAGVVNFILRTNVEGAEVTARYNFADNTNGYQAAGIIGHRWNGGGVMLALQYDHAAQLLQSDRANYYQCDQRAFGYSNNCIAANGSAQSANIGAPGNLIFTTGTTRVYGLPAGGGVGVTAAQLSTTPNVNYAANTAYRAILPEASRYSAVFAGHIDVGPLTLWSEDYYTRQNIDLHNGYLNFSSSVPITNPNFVVVPGQSGTTETVQYALINDGGAARNRGYNAAYQASAGVDARLPAGFKATVYYEHNFNRVHLTTPTLNNTLLNAALACTTSVCFNPYGSGGSASNLAAASSFIGATNQNTYYDSNLVNGKIDGAVFRLPGGDVKIAVGGEWHWDKSRTYSYNNTAAAATSINSQVVTSNTRFSRKITSAFGEVIIPVFGTDNERPGFHRLTINVAGRYDHYSDVGSTTNPKVGITWAPTSDFSLRGSYGTSFRAPTVCDSNPRCTIAVLTSSNGATSVYGQRNANVVTLAGGNPALSPETATTWSAGLDIKPQHVPGLAISFNYFNIDYKNVIYTPGNSAGALLSTLYAPYVTVNPTADEVLNRVINNPNFVGLPTLPGCSTLNASTYQTTYSCVGAIVDGRRNNAGEEKLSGLDFSASYHFDTRIGSLTFGLFGTYLFNYDVSIVPGAPFVASLNQLSVTDASLGDLLRFRARGQLGYSRGGFDFNAFLNYTNAYRVIGLVTTTQNDRVSAYATADATLSYAFGKHTGAFHDLRLAFNVFNLTNRHPPIAVVGTSTEYDPSVANIQGRSFALQITKKF